jgi:hypothetical protein
VDPSFSNDERGCVWLRMRLADSGPTTAGVTVPSNSKVSCQIERSLPFPLLDSPCAVQCSDAHELLPPLSLRKIRELSLEKAKNRKGYG